MALITNKEWSILKNDIDIRNNNVLKNDDNKKNSSKKIKEAQKEKSMENIGKIVIKYYLIYFIYFWIFLFLDNSLILINIKY